MIIFLLKKVVNTATNRKTMTEVKSLEFNKYNTSIKAMITKAYNKIRLCRIEFEVLFEILGNNDFTLFMNFGNIYRI